MFQTMVACAAQLARLGTNARTLILPIFTGSLFVALVPGLARAVCTLFVCAHHTGHRQPGGAAGCRGESI